MSGFLHIASRVEAAVEAYTSVRDFADEELWRAKFRAETVSIHLHGVSIVFRSLCI
jgi:hypothetical protein